MANQAKKKGSRKPHNAGPSDIPMPSGGFDHFDDFSAWMKQRNEGIGDNPKTLGHGRRPGLRRSPEAWAEYINTVLGKQLRASRATMRHKETIADRMVKDVNFQDACNITSTTPSRRQYSRWLRERGNARTALRAGLDSILVQKERQLQDAKDEVKKCELGLRNYKPTIDPDLDEEAQDQLNVDEKQELQDNLDKANERIPVIEEQLATVHTNRKRLLPLAR